MQAKLVFYLSLFLKCMILFYILVQISNIITPLKIILRSHTLIFAIASMISRSVSSGIVDLNKIPYLGQLFICIDYIILNYVANMI